MKDIKLSVTKQEVYDEVMQTTTYAGSKMTSDADAYERIPTVDEDSSQLDRYWSEAKDGACEMFKHELAFESETDGVWELELSLSESFDEALRASMERELHTYFVLSVTAKWYALTNKPEAADSIAQAMNCLESIHRKALYKRRPVRPQL
jgi:hypothetical protein